MRRLILVLLAALAFSAPAISCDSSDDGLLGDLTKAIEAEKTNYDFAAGCKDTPKGVDTSQDTFADLDACTDCCGNAAFDTGVVFGEDCGCTFVVEDDTTCKDAAESELCSTCCEDAGYDESLYFSFSGQGECSCMRRQPTQP